MAGLRLRARRLQLAEALADLLTVKGGGAFLGRLKCQSIVLASQSGLAYLIEADREVEQVIRIVAVGGNRVEISLLRFRPAALAGVQVAEGEVERRRFRLGAEQALQPAFRGVRVACSRRATKHRGLSGRVIGVGDQGALLQLLCVGAAPLAVGALVFR